MQVAGVSDVAVKKNKKNRMAAKAWL